MEGLAKWQNVTPDL